MRLRNYTAPHEPLYPGTGISDARWSFVVDLDEEYLDALAIIQSQSWQGRVEACPMIMPRSPSGSAVIVMVIWASEDRDAARLRLML